MSSKFPFQIGSIYKSTIWFDKFTSTLAFSKTCPRMLGFSRPNLNALVKIGGVLRLTASPDPARPAPSALTPSLRHA